MYFDIDYWWRVVRHVWSLSDWDGRWRMLARLMLWIPMRTLFHGLFFLLDYLLFPRLWFQKVIQPVFIIGHARSGTTLMHRLMSADGDRFSYFLYWEMFFPSLLQKKIIRGMGWFDSKMLRGFLHRKLQEWDDKTFGPVRHMHNISLWNAEEDCFAMAGAFVSQQWSLDIPMMDVVDFFHLDQMPSKRRRWLHHYRELVKRQLLLNGGHKTHLSKNPVMSGWVEGLIEIFPDARFVVMMRDPTECIPSCLKLVQSNWMAKGWNKEDYQNSLDILTGISFEHFRHPREVLAIHSMTPQTVAGYRELIRAPREAVHAVYAALGIEILSIYDSWLRVQAEQEKKHHSEFEYSLGEFFLSAEEIRDQLREFYELHQWDTLATKKETPNA